MQWIDIRKSSENVKTTLKLLMISTYVLHYAHVVIT